MVIFIGNINRLTTEPELLHLLSPFGNIEKFRIMVDKITRRSRGYAYAQMEEAKGYNVISRLNNTSFMGNNLIVRAASAGQQKGMEWK